MSENISEKEVMEVIRANYAGVFPASQKIMDYIMRHPQDVVNFNVSDLAKASGTSDASVVRVCRSLGYDGYSQFRLALARDLGKKQQVPKDPEEKDNFIKNMFSEFCGSLMALADNLDRETVKKCVSIIKEASCVHVIAEGNTSNISQYLGFRLERLGIKSTHYPDKVYFLNQLNFADDKDIVIAISKSGESASVKEGVVIAREKRLKIIAITSVTKSTIAKAADYVLSSNSIMDKNNFYKTYSYLNELAIADALLNFIVNEDLFN